MTHDVPPPHQAEALRHALAQSSLQSALTLHELGLLADYLTVHQYQPGEVIVREGDRERSMYFVVEGMGALRRGDVQLGPLGPGEYFGELGLVAARDRAASIVATTALTALRLDIESYERLTREHPDFTVRLLQTFVDGLAGRLVSMTENVGVLLTRRALPRRTALTPKVLGEPRAAPTGTQLSTLLPDRLAGQRVVAALLDRKAVSLNTPLYSNGEVEALATDHWEGQRVYRRSQALLLLEAAYEVAPEADIRVAHSVGIGQHIAVNNLGERTLAELAPALTQVMRELTERGSPLHEERWSVGEAMEHFSERGWGDAVALLKVWRGATVPVMSYGQVYALSFGPVLPNTSQLRPPTLLNDGHELLLLYPQEVVGSGAPESLRQPSAATPEGTLAATSQTIDIIRTQDLWLETLGVSGIGSFNQACVEGRVSQLIRVSEGFQEKCISRIADAILEREGVKVVFIAGPSSSGKTTFIKRLSVQLQVSGARPLGVSLDDYYVDRELTPRDADGEYDFEALEALRVDLLERDLERLLRGEQVATARYDFPTGVSHPNGGPVLKVGERDLLLLEGIHGLNPALARTIDPARVFRVFICPLSQLPFDRLSRIHASDMRLLRRIVRDRHSRGYSAADNIMRWPSVRRGERAHIFPYQQHADAVFDTSLVYELSVLKVFAERYLLEVPQQHPAYTTAFRLLGLLDRLVTIYPDHVPPTSILREFIGGSGFEY